MPSSGGEQHLRRRPSRSSVGVRISALWDNECKPASIVRHRELGDVDVEGLDDPALAEHLREVAAHVTAMVYQHHRFNMATMLPVGDLALHVAGWTNLPPTVALGVLDGYSPISGVTSSEMTDAVAAIRADPAAAALVRGAGDAGARLDQLRAAVQRSTSTCGPFRIVCSTVSMSWYQHSANNRRSSSGSSVLRSWRTRKPPGVGPTSSHPTSVLGFPMRTEPSSTNSSTRRGRCIGSVTSAASTARSPPSGSFDRALLEVGHRASDRGVIDDPALMLDATPEEAVLVLGGVGPTGDDLAERAELRRRLTADGAPRHLGPPPPPPPPVDELPPALGRMMSSVGFMIEAILGQMDESGGDDTVIQGIGVTDQICEGPARLVRDVDDLLDLEEGEVIVAPATGEAFNSVLHLVAGIVTNHGSHACHAAIVAREMGFPAVVGTVDATTRIRTGDRIRVDGAKGEITLL